MIKLAKTNFTATRSTEKFEKPDKTFPGLAYDNKQILSRLQSGLPVMSGMMEYTGDEYRHVIHDLTDLDHIAEKAKELKAKIDLATKKQKEVSQQLDLKKAVEERLKELGLTNYGEAEKKSPRGKPEDDKKE